MNCEQVRELAADRATGNLSGPTGRALELHLAACPACHEELAAAERLWQKLAHLPEAEPSAELDQRFHAMLQGYREGLRATEAGPTFGQRWNDWSGRWLHLPPRPLLPQLGMALLLLSTGLLVGGIAFSGTSKEPPGTTGGVTAARSERTSSERLRDLESSMQSRLPEERVLSSLLHALDFDPSVNVRLAALDALQSYADQAKVRQSLLDSLAREESPLVQVGLIDLMVEQQEKEAVPVLRALLEKAGLNRAVRKRAAWGLNQLG